MTGPGTFRLVYSADGWRLLESIPADGWVGVFTTDTRPPAGPVAATARAWAAKVLRHRQVRVVSWYPTTAGVDNDFTATTAPWYGRWQVTVYQGGGTVYRRTIDDGWARADGERFSSVADIRAGDNVDLVPVEVSSVPAVLAELGVWRAVAGAWQAGAECLDRACDDYQGGVLVTPGMTEDGCTHLEPVIAATSDMVAVRRVTDALDALTEAAAHETSQVYRAGVLHAVDTIRAAMTDDGWEG